MRRGGWSCRPGHGILFFGVHGIDGLSPVVGAANGFQHIHFSGPRNNPRFYLWTGNVGTTWEDVEFCLCVEWGELRLSNEHLRRFITLCDAGAQARGPPSPGLPMSFWCSILYKLPGIEELELYPACVGILGGACEGKFCSCCASSTTKSTDCRLRTRSFTTSVRNNWGPPGTQDSTAPKLYRGRCACGEGDQEPVKGVAKVVARSRL